MTASPKELQELRRYVTAMDGQEYQGVSADTIILTLTHSNLQQRHAEIRFSKSADTLKSLKRRIYQKTGTLPHHQGIQIWNGEQKLWDFSSSSSSSSSSTDTLDEKPLGFFALPQNATVHCMDTNPHSASAHGQYENVHLVEKYKMSDEEYDKRRGTLRDWCRQQQKVDPHFSLQKHALLHSQLHQAKQHYRLYGTLLDGFALDNEGQVVRRNEKEGGEASATTNVEQEGSSSNESKYGPSSIAPELQVGCRCQVQPGSRRGVVAFVGVVPELQKGGHWVGVVLDEPQALGSLDGVVNGKVYFTVPSPKRGAFVRGTQVEVGDYPERDFLEEDEDEDEL